ncbi:MAG: hypothetical protein U0984_09320 [Prosthecobacter sp.]|nr:hypothetical protein [Prosthecobacter sp.]
MIPLPHALVRKALKLAHSALFAGLCGMVTARGAETTREAPSPNDSGAIPQPLQNDGFEALLASSPFTRSLGVSDSLILTGVARFGNDVFATLLDTKTMDSQVISQTPNGEGWQLIGVGGDPAKLQTWTAKIQIPGGEVISIRYQKPPPKPARASAGASGSGGGAGGNGPPLSASQMEEAKQAAVNYREGFNSDGYPRQPPPEMVEKLSRLSVDQRADINRQMIGFRNRGLGMEERRRIYEDTVNRATQGRR